MDSINSSPMTQSSTDTLLMSPLRIAVLGIVVTSAAITVYHFFLIKYCMRRHGGVADTSPTIIITPRLSSGPFYAGIPPKVLEKIPIFNFSVVKHQIDQDECVVCLGELEDEDEVRLLPLCKHAFHVNCIDRWFSLNANCPICRSIPRETNLELLLDSHRAIDLDREVGESSMSGSSLDSSSPRAHSFLLFRHCMSMMMLPPEERRVPPLLKRSMSMDQSIDVVVNLESDTASSSGGSVPTRSSSCRTRSLSPRDRVSTKWLKSFSRFRARRGSMGTILPY